MSVDAIMVRWVDDYVKQYGCEAVLEYSKIVDEVSKMGVKPGSIIPSDHCYNRANGDPTSFGSKTALFLFLGDKKYQCVGSKYEYDGVIFCKPTGGKELVWGYFDNKTRKKVRCPGTERQKDTTTKEKYLQDNEPVNKKRKRSPESEADFISAPARKISSQPVKPLDKKFIDDMIQSLQGTNKLYDSPIVKCVEERKRGRIFSFSDHLRGYIYAQLSNNRPWAPLEPHLPEIDDIFCNYEAGEIINKFDLVGYQYFVDRITGISCGNRAINAQMRDLKQNIGVFHDLIKEYGSLDDFVAAHPVQKTIQMLSDPYSPYKLRNMGIPLTSEYLRNVGVDCPKPDLHLCRIFGNVRLGLSLEKSAAPAEVFRIIADISDKTGYSQAMIDNVIWSYCADGYGAICSSDPSCNVCVIKDYCKLGS